MQYVYVCCTCMLEGVQFFIHNRSESCVYMRKSRSLCEVFVQGIFNMVAQPAFSMRLGLACQQCQYEGFLSQELFEVTKIF